MFLLIAVVRPVLFPNFVIFNNSKTLQVNDKSKI